MNVLITLPRHLLDKIISGEKRFEMRKVVPRHMKIGEDGFFVVQKGTDEVRCWCRVDEIKEIVVNPQSPEVLSRVLCVTPEYIVNYAPVGTKVYLWGIGKVMKLQDLCRDLLIVDKNPQSFAYCPLSYAESY